MFISDWVSQSDSLSEKLKVNIKSLVRTIPVFVENSPLPTAPQHVHAYTVHLLLSDQLWDHKKMVAEEKRSPNATKVHHIKQRDSIFYT